MTAEVLPSGARSPPGAMAARAAIAPYTRLQEQVKTGHRGRGVHAPPLRGPRSFRSALEFPGDTCLR